MSDSVRPQRQQPTRFFHPWDSPGKNTGVGCHFLLQCMKVKSERGVAQSCLTLSDPMDCSPPGPWDFPDKSTGVGWVFLIGVIVLFVFFFFFISSAFSLNILIDSCIFSILFSRFWITFTMITPYSLSGSLPIFSLLIWSFEFLPCSFICSIFLYLFFSFFFFFPHKLLCLRSPFPSASVIYLPVHLDTFATERGIWFSCSVFCHFCLPQ